MSPPDIIRLPYARLLRALLMFFILPFSGVKLAAQTQPAGTSLEINAGQSQRSMLRNLKLTVPTGRTLASPGVRIHSLGTRAELPPTAFSVTPAGTPGTYGITFPNPPGNALPDGNYLLTVVSQSTASDPARLQDTYLFHAYFGDHDGDRDVDYLDTSFLGKTWNLSNSSANFDPSFDSDGSGTINQLDIDRFQTHYFKLLAADAAVSAFLTLDDGTNPNDGITTTPGIRGTIDRTSSTISGVLRGEVRRIDRVRPDPSQPYAYVLTSDLTSPGAFALEEPRLSTLNGGPFAAGVSYRFYVQLVMPGNLVVAVNFTDFTIDSTRGNTAPQLIPPGDRVIPTDLAFSTTIFATDVDPGDTLTFSLVSGPPGLTIDPSGKLDWPAQPDALGPQLVTVRIEDREAAFDTGSFSITVEKMDTPGFAAVAPVISVPPASSLLVGETYSAVISATDADPGDTLTYSLPAAPSGMTIDPATGSVSWTPVAGQSGPSEITAGVTDSFGLSDFGTFVVTPNLPNRGPLAVNDIFTTPKGVTTTIPATGVLANDSDPDGSPLTAQLISGPLNGTLALRPDGSFDYTPGTGNAAIVPRLAYAADSITTFGSTGVINVNRTRPVGTVSRAVCSDLDGDGKPEIIVPFQKAPGVGNTGHLVALKLDEATGRFSPLWTFAASAGEQNSIYDAMEPAVGDVTGDGKPEVVVNGQCEGEVLIFSNTGELLVSTQADKTVGNGIGGSDDCYSSGLSIAPQIADLDGDGLAEIITPARGKFLRVMNGIGEILWEKELPFDLGFRREAGVLIADFDLDGAQEIYYAGTFFDKDGNVLRTMPDAATRSETFLAFANLDDDPHGEILNYSGQTLQATEHDGTCKWVASPDSNPPSGSGCGTPLPFPHNFFAPTATALIVADLQGDGKPDIITSSASDFYFNSTISVFNRDGEIQWQVEPTVGENLLGRANITAFDFNGDGTMEIVASGLHGTVFLSGVDGRKLFEIPGDNTNPGALFSTVTPIVVDVEADGHAELVLTSNHSRNQATGVFVYKDANDRWMPARSVWNQHAGFVTNVNEDGSIPRKPAINWLTPGLNNYGVNVPGPDEASSTDSFTYRVTDGEFTSNIATVTLEIRKPNRPPFFLSTPRLAAAPDSAYRYNVIATDPDVGDNVTISLVSGPTGLTLDAGNVLRWTPTQANLGSYPVTLAATDREGAVALQNYTLRIVNAQLVPDVVGRTQSAAIGTLEDAGFVGGRITRENHPTTPAGSVIRQLPLAGASELPGTAVDLVISNGNGSGNPGGNRSPLAVDDSFTTPKGVTTTIRPAGVINNDLDPDGSPLTVELVSGPRNGTLDLRPDGSFDYTPGTGTAPFSPKLAFSFKELNGLFFGTNNSGFDQYDSGNVTVADLDGDGKPEILAIGIRNDGFGRGWLVALKLDESTNTLTPIWDRQFPSLLRATEPAVGDVTGDGIPEIVIGTDCMGKILILSNTGELLVDGFTGNTEPCANTPATPEIVDLDGDGLAEIVIGYNNNSVRVYSGTGELIWERQAVGNYTAIQRILIADVDLDGELNIYHAGILYDAHGNQLWRLPDSTFWMNDWGVAAANLDDDPYAEIVKLEQGGVLRVMEHDGTCKWVASNSTNPPAGSDCSTPIPFFAVGRSKTLIVADINGDGQSNILVASSNVDTTVGNSFAVFNRDGSILWQATATVGANALGIMNAAAFDFNGDGVMEIVASGWGGTCFLSGADGSKLYEIPSDNNNPGGFSASVGLHPIIVDLENDGHAELVIASRDGGFDQTQGIHVYKDIADNWMPTRPVWNQGRYYITNVNADGSIPRKPLVNWLTPGLNNYGVNVPAPGEASSTDSFTYRLSDGEFTSNVATVTLEVRKPNRPPIFLSTPRLAAVPDYEYRYDIFTTDPDVGDAVTVSYLNGPTGMTLGEGNVLRWTPLAADLGEHTVTLAAKDKEGDTTLQTFTLRVIPAQLVPDVVGQTQAVALTTIDGAGFAAGKITREDHPSVPAGSVISQLPLAGASEPPNTAVALVVSNGPGPGYTDGDGDGFTPNQGDCDDTDPSIHPGAPDPEGDGIDQDCNGIDGNLTLASILVEPINPRVLTNQNVPLTATGIFTDGTSQNLTAVVTWSSGAPRFSSATAGNFPVTATLNSITGSTNITIVDQVADAAPPLAEITSPSSGSTVTAPTDVIGSALDPNFLKYELAYAPAGTEDFTVFASGNNPVTNAALGKFDPTLLLNDQYTIRLTVFDQGRNRSTAETTVIVDGDLKVGNFSLAFTDLEIPMAGIPIAVTRIYDSRDKSKGDFGVGWTMGFRSIRISTNRIPGSGWSVAHSGLAFALQKTDEHIVTVTHPDGHVDEFDLVVSPDVSPIVPFPISIITATFKPRAGTMGRLEAIGNNTLSIYDPQPGPASLLDDTTLEVYNPQRFRYTDHDGNVIILHKVNGVESITDLNGNSVRFTPNGIFHSAGRSVAFTRDNSGRIVKITDPNGAEQSYSYDANGDLRVHEDADANRTRIAYNRNHGLIRIEDPTGNIGIRTEYDDDGRLIATIDAAGNRTDFIRDMAAREESVRDAQGNIQRFRYDEDGNVLSSERSVTSEGAPILVREFFEYDGKGNQTAHVDADGVRSTYEYDMMDRIVRTEVDPDGLAIISSTNYDAEGNVIAQTDPVGNVARFTYGSRRNIQSFTNAAGATNRYEFDEKGQAVSSTDIFGARTAATFDSSGRPVQQDTFEADSSLLSRIQYTYDSNGNELTRTTFKTRNGVLTPSVTTYAYDATGRRIRTTDPEGGISQTEYDSRGLVSATVDALGRRTEFEYDLRSQPAETRYPDGTTEQKTYDFKGRLLTETDASGRITRHEYDELGREIRVILPDGSALKNIWSPAGRLIASIDARENRTDFDYDSAGRRIGTRLPQVTDATTGGAIRPVITSRLNAGGRVVGLKDANGNETIFTLNALGKISRTVNPDGTSRDATFDVGGRMLSATDELGRVTSFSYDSLGRLREVKQPRSDQATAPSVTRYDYDLDGRQISRTDALGKITRYDYDKLGRRVRRTLPSGVYESSEFDAVGNEVRHTALDGKVSTISYDDRNRGVLAIDGDGIERRIQYTDSGDRQSISDSGGTTSYAYDAMGRITLVTNPNGESLAFTWDGSGNRTSVDSPSGKTTYGYDAVNRLIRVASPDGVTLQGYDSNGNEVSVIRPNGTKTLSAINSMNRVTSLEHRTASDEVLAFFNSTYASNGQRLSVAEADGSVESYRYDGMGRLIGEQRVGTSPRSLTYEYDAVGNRTARNRDGIMETYSYGTDDQLLRAGTKFYTYDANGNRTSKTIGSSTTRYAWNARNRLASTNMGGSAISFTYDADGNRIRSDSAESGRDFLLDTVTPDSLSRVLEERDQAGQTLATFDYGNRLLSVDRGGVQQVLTDPHGSTRLTTGAGGTAENPLTYEAFGVQRSGDISSEIEHLFAGEQFDPATGLYYLRARYYDPETGVFLSRDPHEGDDANPQTQSPYTYASNDPINLIDPSGRFSLTELSISNAIQNSLNALRISANFCNSLGRARGVAGAISLISTMLAGQSGGFDGNTFDFTIENTAPARPLGSKIEEIGIEAKTKSNPLSLSAGATFKFQGGLPDIKIGVEASAKNIKFDFGVAVGDEFDLFDVTSCGFVYLSVKAGHEDSVGYTYSAETGHGIKVATKFFFKIQSLLGIKTEVPFLGVEGIKGSKKSSGVITLPGNFQIPF